MTSAFLIACVTVSSNDRFHTLRISSSLRALATMPTISSDSSSGANVPPIIASMSFSHDNAAKWRSCTGALVVVVVVFAELALESSLRSLSPERAGTAATAAAPALSRFVLPGPLCLLRCTTHFPPVTLTGSSHTGFTPSLNKRYSDVYGRRLIGVKCRYICQNCSTVDTLPRFDVALR